VCGIAGFVDFAGHAPEEARHRVRRMTELLIHRGPDGEGFFVDRFAALGHRRLAIIDLASGQQPMSALAGRVQIVFNGEIYNYLEVRAELALRGHRFETHSDTEVILGAYVEWGERCPEHLAGMFAFAIWDARVARLLLARDRVGKKPLYYTQSGTKVAFASELKALRAAGFGSSAVDPEALDCYLTLGYVPAPRTIHPGTLKLRAAHALSVTATGAQARRYWTLSFAEPLPRRLEEATEELASLLDQAVKCRLMSEVPLGAFLSGGIDSSLVVSSMARLTARPVITNSIGFDEPDMSEIPVAARIAHHLGTDHREFVVKPQAVEILARIAWHLDEPFADPSAVPTWYVCQMARRAVTVALSGDGGDEGFAGYTFRYRPHVLESQLRARLPTALRGPLFGALGALWPASARLPRPLRLRTILENLACGDAQAFYRDLAAIREDTRSRLYAPEFLESLQGFTPMETVAPYYVASDAPDALGRSQFTDIQLYMTDDVLVKVDRMSMAHSLEVRAPLLDHRILEFAARLPAKLKMNHHEGKRPLRALAAQRLPQDIHGMPKKGFTIPAARWLRAELRPLIEEHVLGSSGLAARVLERSAVRALWQQHLTGARDHSAPLWALLMLGLWERGLAQGQGSG